jgi:hypothetical protein
MAKNKLNLFLYLGVSLLLLLVLFNSYYIFSLEDSINAKIVEAKELARPARIEIIKIDSSCSFCFDVNDIINDLKDSVEVINEISLSENSAEAQNIISEYEIEKLPTIILKGEIDKLSLKSFKQVKDALVFDGVSAPYQDVTGKIIGSVSGVIIEDRDCDGCSDASQVIDAMESSGVYFGSKKELDISDSEAIRLIDELNIGIVPVIIISEDVDAYPSIAQNIRKIGKKIKGYYVIETQPPYVDVKTGEIRGRTELIMLEDSSCAECYDVEVHKSILNRFGVYIESENKVDVNSSEGQELIDKYNIELVPTVIIKGDVEVYTNLNNIWSRVGSIENDGVYVFRDLKALGRRIVYKNLTSGNIEGIR